MARLEEVVLVCDLCERKEGDGVSTHTVEADGKRVQLEGCDTCWRRIDKALTAVLAKGRRIPKVKR